MSGYNNNRGGNQGNQQRGGKPPLPPRLADYRTVNDRINALVLDYPGDTQITCTAQLDKPIAGWVLFSATVSRRAADGGEWLMGTGSAAIPYTVDDNGRERNPVADAWEKGETAARGRALVAAGYTSSLESAAEMEAAYEKIAAQEERERRENAAHASPDGPQAQEVPQPTTATPATPQSATKPKKAAAGKVGIVSAAGEARGETVEEAAAAHARIAPVGAAQAKAEIFEDSAPQPVAVEPTPIDSGLASQSPAFRRWIDSRHEEAENGVDFETIQAAFKKQKPNMSPAQYTIGMKELAKIKTRCAEVAATNAEAAALAPDVATELAQLSEQERAFVAS